jgi:hypothetical protein
MNLQKNLYWTATLLLSLMTLASGILYLIRTEEIKNEFLSLGHPTHIIVPLAVAKILAVITILRNRWQKLVEWAYAGLFFDFVLAATAHLEGSGRRCWRIPICFSCSVVVLLL